MCFKSFYYRLDEIHFNLNHLSQKIRKDYLGQHQGLFYSDSLLVCVIFTSLRNNLKQITGWWAIGQANYPHCPLLFILVSIPVAAPEWLIATNRGSFDCCLFLLAM